MLGNLEIVSGLERRLTFSVSAAEVDTAVASRLKVIAKTAKLPGFRPGKVPQKILQQQYGFHVRQEALSQSLQKSFGEAVQQSGVRIAGDPAFEPVVAEGTAQPSEFAFTAVFEVYPEVKVGDLAGRTFERLSLEVSDADVNKTIETMREQSATYEPVLRAGEATDRLTISYVGKVDGEAFAGGTAENQTMILGKGRMLPEFETQLMGASAGKTLTFDLQFPDDYHGKEVAGKKAQFEVTVSEVAAAQLPALDEAFAKAQGVVEGGIDKLLQEVRKNLESEVKFRLQSQMKTQVMDALIEVTPVEVPKALVDSELEILEKETRQGLIERGIPNQENMPIPRDIFEPKAKRRVMLGLILAEVTRHESLQPAADQVRAHVTQMAQSYENPDEVVSWVYSQPDQLRQVEMILLEENVVTWAQGKGQTVDKIMTFDELMGYKK
jgi:trigger factor